MNGRLTLDEAAQLARTDAANVRAALASGDLRSLDRKHVRGWIRGLVAGAVTRSLRPKP